jgi:hypothetical protein
MKRQTLTSTLELVGLDELKPNYFKKQSSSSSFLLTLGNNTGPKWQ